MEQKQEGVIPSAEPFFTVALSAGTEEETAEAQEDWGEMTPAEYKELKECLMDFVKTVTGRAGSGVSYSDEVQIIPAIAEILLTRF
jgi:hypothetical protein